MNSNAKPQVFTFISRSAPYGSNRPQICLDAALAAAVFEQQINYLFMGDGILQLLKDQNAENINSKTLGSALETLELYGIENIYVDGASLASHNVALDDLVVDVTVLEGDRLSQLIQQSDAVFNL